MLTTNEDTFLKNEIDLALEEVKLRRLEPEKSLIVPIYLEDPATFGSKKELGSLRCLREMKIHDIRVKNDSDQAARAQLIQAITNSPRRLPKSVRERLLKEVEI
jgi:hypothetical protein